MRMSSYFVEIVSYQIQSKKSDNPIGCNLNESLVKCYEISIALVKENAVYANCR